MPSGAAFGDATCGMSRAILSRPSAPLNAGRDGAARRPYR
jgi:hypothetical protein